ncbi:MAG: hypothetical protein PHX61_13075 [Alphaproteobacteria bacterium]|nr:hypothetical protein [Alphaproteobacteria bacterium]
METVKTSDQIIAAFLEHVPTELRKDVELVFRKCKFDQVDDPIFAMSLHLLFMQLGFREITEKLLADNKEKRELLSLMRRRDKTRAHKDIFWKKWIGIFVFLNFIFISMFFCAYFFKAAETERNDVYQNSATDMNQLNIELKNKLKENDVGQVPGRGKDRLPWLLAGGLLLLTLGAMLYFLKYQVAQSEKRTIRAVRELLSIREVTPVESELRGTIKEVLFGEEKNSSDPSSSDEANAAPLAESSEMSIQESFESAEVPVLNEKEEEEGKDIETVEDQGEKNAVAAIQLGGDSKADQKAEPMDIDNKDVGISSEKAEKKDFFKSKKKRKNRHKHKNPEFAERQDLKNENAILRQMRDNREAKNNKIQKQLEIDKKIQNQG